MTPEEKLKMDLMLQDSSTNRSEKAFSGLGKDYSRELKSFKDFPEGLMPIGTRKVFGGIETLLPETKLSDLVSKSILGKTPLTIETQAPRSQPTFNQEDVDVALASNLRQMVQDRISKLMAEKKVLPESQLANPKDLNVINEELLTYNPSTGKKDIEGLYSQKYGTIFMDPKLSPANYRGTLAHEVGHQAEVQGIGTEGSKDMTTAQKVVSPVGDRSEQELAIAQEPYNKKSTPAEIINKYYKKHHRRDAPEAWEVSALKNIENKGILREPYTPDIRGKYKEYLKILEKLDKK